MKKVLNIFLSVFLLTVSVSTAFAKDDFPGRKLFLDVKFIELTALDKMGDKAVIVDVRSKYEYEILRVKGSIHIPVSQTLFGQKIRELRAKTNKAIVFYCNGHTCFKSYKATRRAQSAGVKNVFAFDGGIFDWARAHPNRAVLLGRSPVNPQRLLSKKKLNQHMLPAKAFQARFGKRSLILDVRSRLQRAGTGLFVMDGEKHASMSDKGAIAYYVNKAKREGKTMLIYDAVGKQVRWFQYYMERAGVKYYFMKGGSEGYFKTLTLK